MDFALFATLTYAIAFGLQNKADFLKGRHPFLDRLLVCAYCTGFHAGWMAWGILSVTPDNARALAALSWGIPATILAHALAGSGLTYAIDAAICWLEGNTPVATAGIEDGIEAGTETGIGTEGDDSASEPVA